MQKDLVSLPKEIVAAKTSGLTNEGTDNIRAQFYSLLVRLQEMEARFTGDVPSVKELRQQVADAKKTMEQEEQTRTSVTQSPNKPYEEQQIALLRQEPKLAALTARLKTVETQLGGAKAELTAINEAELQIHRLEREVALSDFTYRKHSESLEMARIDAALEKQRITNISVTQTASLELKPIWPKKGIMAAFGFMLATGCTVLYVIAREWKDRTIRRPEDIDRYLGVPNLVSIPRLDRHQVANHLGRMSNVAKH